MRNPYPYPSFQHLFLFSLSWATRMRRQVMWPSTPAPHLTLFLGSMGACGRVKAAARWPPATTYCCNDFSERCSSAIVAVPDDADSGRGGSGRRWQVIDAAAQLPDPQLPNLLVPLLLLHCGSPRRPAAAWSRAGPGSCQPSAGPPMWLWQDAHLDEDESQRQRWGMRSTGGYGGTRGWGPRRCQFTPRPQMLSLRVDWSCRENTQH
jgi:hypothetical protein